MKQQPKARPHLSAAVPLRTKLKPGRTLKSRHNTVLSPTLQRRPPRSIPSGPLPDRWLPARGERTL